MMIQSTLKKTGMALIAVLAMVFMGGSAVAADVDNATSTGIWGDVPYQWDGNTETLTITGTGHVGMPRYLTERGKQPWRTGAVSPENIKNIVFKFPNSIVLPKDSSRLFYGLKNVEKIAGIGFLDASAVQDMSSMFAFAKSLKSMDLSPWDTSKVTSVSDMFGEASSLKYLDLSKWDTTKMTDMSAMFYGTSSLATIKGIADWDTSNLELALLMFDGASSLKNLDLTNWDTHKIKDMSQMFYQASSLESLDIYTWNTSSVQNMSYMFAGTSSLEYLNLADWRTSNLVRMPHIFDGAVSLKHLDISGWLTDKVQDMSYMFANTSSLKEIELSGWNTDRDLNMTSLFAGSNVEILTLGRYTVLNSDVALWNGVDERGVWNKVLDNEGNLYPACDSEALIRQTQQSSFRGGTYVLRSVDVLNYDFDGVYGMFPIER